MKLRNRKGSTLALTIIIFAVLMIFATFTMGFMVTENKQSIYYQNKTQAYYIAKSGADIIGEALNKKLNSISNIAVHNSYIDNYIGGVDVSINIDGLISAVVNKETINGQPVLTILTTARFPDSADGIVQSVKKVMYNNRSFISSEYFIPNTDGKLFQFLNQDDTYYPTEYLNNGSNNIHEVYNGKYTSRANSETASMYKSMEWQFNTTNFSLDNPAKTWPINDGIYKLPEGNLTIGSEGAVTNIYVDGPLELDSSITFVGTVNLHVRDYLIIDSYANIIGDYMVSDTDEEDKTYGLNIYVYGDNLNDGKSVYTTGNLNVGIKETSIIGNLVVKTGSIDIFYDQDVNLDGSIIFYGNSENDEDNYDVKFSSKDNGNGSADRLISGSILAPHAEVKLGVHVNKVANVVGGYVISDKISVYANTNNQSTKFYDASGKGNSIIQTELPIESNELTNVDYGSYYINPNQ